jgi:hypothetical protein
MEAKRAAGSREDARRTASETVVSARRCVCWDMREPGVAEPSIYSGALGSGASRLPTPRRPAVRAFSVAMRELILPDATWVSQRGPEPASAKKKTTPAP